MKTGALLFMLGSWIVVLGLLVWTYTKIMGRRK
jgi:hypothetical protein